MSSTKQKNLDLIVSLPEVNFDPQVSSSRLPTTCLRPMDLHPGP